MQDVKNESDLEDIKTNVFGESYISTVELLNNIINSTLTLNSEDLHKYNCLFNKILSDAGFYKITLYWLGNNNMGIISDEFTNKIKDFEDLARRNDLVNLNYQLIDKEKAPSISMRYDTYIKYNSSLNQENNYKKLVKALLDDKKNYNVKIKVIFY